MVLTIGGLARKADLRFKGLQTSNRKTKGFIKELKLFFESGCISKGLIFQAKDRLPPPAIFDSTYKAALDNR